jgi:hypothetical protein
MRTRSTVYPGFPGSKKALEEYGDRLVCVRYRVDVERRKRYRTVELIVAEWDWKPERPMENELVAIRVGLDEVAVRRQVKAERGIWHQGKKVWILPYGRVAALGLEERIVEEEEG